MTANGCRADQGQDGNLSGRQLELGDGPRSPQKCGRPPILLLRTTSYSARLSMLVQPGTVVMIVDDDSLVRQAVADVLGLEGYEVLPLAGGESALARMASGLRPSVVILDLWLPGMGSVELARRIRELPGRIPLMLLTAWPAWKQLPLDPDAVLSTPAEATAIVRAVDKLTSHRTVGVDCALGPGRRPPKMALRPDAAWVKQSCRR